MSAVAESSTSPRIAPALSAQRATLRVLYVHSGNLYGGIEVFHRTVAELAHGGGMDIEFALCFEGRLSDDLSAMGVVVHLLDPIRLRDPRSLVRGRRTLRERIASGRYDVVVCNSTWSMAALGAAIRASGVPFVFHLHDTLPSRDWLARLAARTRPNAIVCNSEYTASTVDAYFAGVPRSIVSYPVALRPAHASARAETRAALGASSDTVVLLQASRMQAWKGHELFVDALARLPRNLCWTAWLAGGAQRDEEKAYEAALRDRVRRAGIEDRVRFLGQRDDVPSLMAAADIFCQPNAGGEPFGIVFVEALSAGLPVVSTAMGGALEIVDRTCGVLVPRGDTAALTFTLEHLVRDLDARRSLSSGGPARARLLCDPPRQTSRLADALSAVARKARTPYVIVTARFAKNAGQDRANLALAEQLASRGHETHLVAFEVDEALARSPGVNVHRVPFVFGRYVLAVPLLGARGIALARSLPGARIVVNGGNCLAPDAINWVHYVHAADRATGRRGLSAPKNAIARTTERIALGAAHFVLANSERTRRDLIEHVGVADAKIRVVYLGIDAEFQPLSAEERARVRASLGWDERPRAVFVGALGDDRKGFDTVYAAWARLCKQESWDGHLVVCGGGRSVKTFAERARADGMAARVSLLGFRTDVARIVAASDFMVAAPRYEPYGLNVHESLACALPTITSACSGVAEVYPEALRDWLLPDADDDVDLAARIARVREGVSAPPPALDTLSRTLRARTWNRVAEDLISAIEEDTRGRTI